jgi:hypothetical protein
MKLFEQRKNNLINLLEETSDELDPGRQHQIYGAILEIDLMLKTLEHHNNNLIKNKLNQRKNKILNLD